MYFDYWTDSKKIVRLNYIVLKGRKPGYTTDLHWHLYNEILYLDYGEMKITGIKETFYLKPGECFLIPSNYKHIVENSGKSINRFLNIGYRGIMPEELTISPLKLGQKCIEILREIGDLSKPPFTNLKGEIAACKLSEFFLRLHQQVISDAPAVERMPINRKHYYSELVNRIIDIIEERFMAQLELKDVAEELGVSVSQVRVLLKKETSQTFVQHLQNYRMEKAKQLIMDGVDNINTVAKKCGYNSQPFFFKVFRRFTGMTPFEFAKTLGSPEDNTNE